MDSQRRCESPRCTESFEPEVMPGKPRRYCSPKCRQETSLIRLVGDLYGLEIEAVHEALTKEKQP